MSSVSLAFRETMHGFYARPSQSQTKDWESNTLSSFRTLEAIGKDQNQRFRFRLKIEVSDIDSFLNDPLREADASGTIECPELGGEIAIDKGWFNLFIRPSDQQESTIVREMRYRLYFRSQGKEFTFYGYKAIEEGQIGDVWQETTTLYSTIWFGHSEEPGSDIWGRGVLTLTPSDFLEQMKTFESSGHNFFERMRAFKTFTKVFAAQLFNAYLPQVENEGLWSEVKYAVHTMEGIHNAKIIDYTVNTQDGLTLKIQRFLRSPSPNPVVLLHGLTTSTDMFIMPEHENIVQYLLDHGYTDVWSIDWRGSSRHAYNLEPHSFSMDEPALFDVLPSLDLIHKETKANLHVVSHCLGGLAAMMGLAAQPKPYISSLIVNSVGLMPRTSLWSRIKLRFAPFLVEKLLRYPYVSPRMPYFPGLAQGKWLRYALAISHRECQHPACHMISFMWGSGKPAAYQHENMARITHERIHDLFGGTSLNYHRHIQVMVAKGRAVSVKALTGAPADYFEAYLQQTNRPPLLLVSGSENHIFPGANRVLFDAIKSRDKVSHVEYLEIKSYGHQDIFMGKNAAQDVFPHLLGFLNRYGVKP